MRIGTWCLLTALVSAWALVPAEAQLIVDPANKAEPGQFEVGGAFSLSQIEYDGDCTVSYTGGDFLSVYRALLAMFWIATSSLNP